MTLTKLLHVGAKRPFRPSLPAEKLACRALILGLLTLGVLTACKTQSRCAEGVTKKGVAALRLGLTEQEVLNILGPPLTVARYSDGRGSHALLTYASAAEWRLGSHHLLS